MVTRRRSLILQRQIRLALLTYAISFGFGFFLSRNLASHSLALWPLFRPKSQLASGNITVKAQTKQNGEASSAAMLPTLDQQAAIKHLSFSIPKQFQAKTFADVKLSEPEKLVALTFDDGPQPRYTEEILNILKQYNIKATFFCVGEMVQRYPQLAREVVTNGNAVGNHTWHHWYRRMDALLAAREVENTAAIIDKMTGVTTSLFRPPGGILNNGPAEYAKEHKYGVVMWSTDSEDYTRPPVPRLVRNVLHHVEIGGIVLMHDGGGNRSHTVRALPQIINALLKSGYKFVTVPELLAIKAKERSVNMATQPTSNSMIKN